MNSREIYEILNWTINRTLYLVLEKAFVEETPDKKIREDLREWINPILFRLKGDYSLKALKQGNFGLGEKLEEFESLKKFFPKGNYEWFPHYASCSWKLNKELRRKHDLISEYLN